MASLEPNCSIELKNEISANFAGTFPSRAIFCSTFFFKPFLILTLNDVSICIRSGDTLSKLKLRFRHLVLIIFEGADLSPVYGPPTRG